MAYILRNSGYVYDSETKSVYATQEGLCRLCAIKASQIPALETAQQWETKEGIKKHGILGNLYSPSQCSEALLYFSKRGNYLARTTVYEMAEAGIYSGRTSPPPKNTSPTKNKVKKRKKHNKLSRKQGYIYIISAGNSAIKVGWSTQPTERLAGLQTASHERLTIICQKPGTLAQEQAFHRKYKEQSLHGEWYPTHLTQEVKRHLGM